MPSNEDPQESILKRSLGALKWTYIGVIFRIGLQLAAQITIAREIGPADFGTASAAVFILLLTNLVVELGLGASLVQKQVSPTPDDLRLVQRFILAAASIAVLLLYSLSGPIARFWGDPKVAPLLQGLTIAVIAQACGIASLSILRRELDFKWIQFSQVAGYFIGFVIFGIGVAIVGGGAWSLVVAWVVQNICTTAMLYWRARHPIDIWRSIAEPDRKMTKYGLRVLVVNLANWVIENIDNLMIGKAFGTSALANYAVSYNLVRTPTNHLVTAIQQVLFPASARTSGNDEDHGLTYLVVIWGVTLIAAPIFFSVALLSDVVIGTLYGQKWEAAAAMLLPLALAMPFHAAMAVGGPLLWGRGEAGREMRVQIAVGVILVVLLGGMMTLTPEAMAWAVAGVYVCRSIWIQIQVAESTHLRPTLVFRSVAPGLCLGAIVSTLLWCADCYWASNSYSSSHRLLLALVIGMVLVAPPILFVAKLLPSEVRLALLERRHLPPKLRRILGLR